MYVCICHAITDREIREVVNRGANSLPDVQQHVPVAGCCGRCQDTAQQIVEECVLRRVQREAA